MASATLSWLFARNVGAREAAVDALRGLTIAGMILVNHPGPTGAYFAPLMHARWDGWTLADTIFPGFLFIVGFSIALSYSDRQGRPTAPSGRIYLKILRRAVLLLLLNIALVNFPYYEWATLKLTGTLSRIALCSAAGALIFLHLGWRAQIVLLVSILGGHWLLVGGLGAETVLKIDQALLGSHLRPEDGVGFDSTGPATSIAAVSSTIFGLLAGRWFRSQAAPADQAAGLLATGFALYLLGSFWGWYHPINKMLWSSSFVTLMAGMSMMTLGLMLRLEARQPIRSWLRPAEIAGMNALAFYVCAGTIQRLLVYAKFTTGDDGRTNLLTISYDLLFGHWVQGAPGALMFALTVLLICYAVVFGLYRARIFIRL